MKEHKSFRYRNHSIFCIFLGLRKVTDDMKTHKNKELRASSVVKAGEVKTKPAPKYGSSSSASSVTKKPPVLALQGKKWVVVSDLLLQREGKKYMYFCSCRPQAREFANRLIQNYCHVTNCSLHSV